MGLGSIKLRYESDCEGARVGGVGEKRLGGRREHAKDNADRWVVTSCAGSSMPSSSGCVPYRVEWLAVRKPKVATLLNTQRCYMS